MRAMAETLRSTVGRAAEVPRKVTESMGANIRERGAGSGERVSRSDCVVLSRRETRSSLLEDLDRQIPPGPLFQIRQELGQGLEGRVQVVVQHRIARDLPQRPLPL